MMHERNSCSGLSPYFKVNYAIKYTVSVHPNAKMQWYAFIHSQNYVQFKIRFMIYRQNSCVIAVDVLHTSKWTQFSLKMKY